MFTRNKLTSAILGVLAVSAVSPVLAQGEENLEEVFVSGIRASLEASMDVKRESAGVVDAISAEDIGKFPDTNLAESLQRITGVSIDRVNGEGSQITVRGFGPQFNMVTLNGRAMPAGSTYGGGSGAGGTTGGATRAFDFANLASESVQGVQVYKTGRADIASGGMGATVNISTTRPLEKEGTTVSVAAKGVHDTTTRIGKYVTPELSGLYSWSDGTFGVALSGSYQLRHSGAAAGFENNWNIARWGETDMYRFRGDRQDPNDPAGTWPDDGHVIVNEPADGQLYGRPNDFRWAYSDRERERTNAQATFQWAPTQNITATADYTFAKNDLWEHRGEWTQWMGNNEGSPIVYLEFDDSPVATPILIGEEEGGNRDVGYEQQLRMQSNKLESTGLNLDWQLTDAFSLALDAHSSTMESLPNGPGGAGSIAISIGAPVSAGYTWDFTGDMPVGWFDLDDTDQNANGKLDEKDAGSAQGRIWYAGQTTELDQIKLDGSYEFEWAKFDFGVDSIKTEMTQQSSNNSAALGNWNVSNPGEFEYGTLSEFNFADYYKDYDMSRSAQTGLRANDVVDLCRQTEILYGNRGLGVADQQADQDWSCTIRKPFTANNFLEETVNGAYLQISLNGELGGRTWNLLAGVRYEDTDFTSTSTVQLPAYRVWQGNNDFQETIYRGTPDDVAAYAETNSYSNTLPNIDFDIELIDNLVARASYSTTISRANYGNLYVGAGNFSQTDPTGYLGATPTANGNNPQLVPLESDNIDLSLEWYYGEGSYASIGYFDKTVNNFIGTSQVVKSHYDMVDASADGGAGTRMNQVYSDLATMGYNDPGSNQLFAQAVCVTYDTNYNQGYGDSDPYSDEQITFLQGLCQNEDSFNPALTSADYYVPGTNQVFLDWVEGVYDVHGLLDNADHPEFSADPMAQWTTSAPVNNKEAGINGAEVAVQHFFGDSGFGVQANYTMVDGDVEFDDLADPTEEQFALLGLSDTMNIVGIYEKYGFQLRVAYNWRDSFLRQTNQGGSRNPVYVDEYSQIDLNASYDINDNFNVFFEGLNLTGENVRWYQRSNKMTKYVEELGSRYQLGVRYNF
ncbi:TonB-dependent receptor [Alteromonadaceae bacterium Bs31]|nr:TonB-dependent receptor [Alteromonadaceae bacterium Bs31]